MGFQPIEKEYLRNNPNLKSTTIKQYVDIETFQFRIQEMKKISQDIIYFAKNYFYILSLDNGKCLINPYKKQQQIIRNFAEYNRNITLASRQSGKSTSYSVYILWYIIVNHDKNVLICANRLKTATQILSRIKMAYEELPPWLKPGVIKWNSTQIQFSNGCKVSAQATSQSSGRGQSINCLVLDQFAFISKNMQQTFMQSVFPVISSSKNSQIIIVSTPNGMDNEYYRIWNKAILNTDKNNKLLWHANRIDWFDVPGRDEEWKKQQIESFNGDMTKFNQQYGNDFIGSAQTLIAANVIKKFKSAFQEKQIKFSKEFQLHKDFPQTKINIYSPPQKGRAYIIGADPSTGSQSDFHAMTVWDITNLYNIQLVADFYHNNLPPKYFAYIIAKTATLYNKAYVAIENNGVSFATLDKIFNDFEYENVIHDGKGKISIGISSSDDKKIDACIHFKQILEDPYRTVNIYNGNLIDEMQRFQRKDRNGKIPKYACFNGHDDLIMSMIWAFYYLNLIFLQNFYDVRKYAVDKFGKEIPIIIASQQNLSQQEIEKQFYDIDKLFQLTAKPYDIQMKELQNNIQLSQQNIMSNFLSSNVNIKQNNFNEFSDSFFQF